MKNCAFYELLHGRRDEKSDAWMTTTLLAKQAGIGRCHLSGVINGTPGRGKYTRQRLFPYLTEEEVRTLGWSEEYNRWRRETNPKFQGLAACSTGNNVPISEAAG